MKINNLNILFLEPSEPRFRFRNRNRGTVKIWNRLGTGTAEPSKFGTASEPEPRNRQKVEPPRNRNRGTVQIFGTGTSLLDDTK